MGSVSQKASHYPNASRGFVGLRPGQRALRVPRIPSRTTGTSTSVFVAPGLNIDLCPFTVLPLTRRRRVEFFRPSINAADPSCFPGDIGRTIPYHPMTKKMRASLIQINGWELTEMVDALKRRANMSLHLSNKGGINGSPLWL